jgi:Protein of unknown function (DUF2442)
MTTSEVEARALAHAVECTDDELIVSLLDGRTISIPILWFPKLADATPEQRANFEILGQGEGIHWPDIDQDLSVEGLLRGTR